MTIVYSVLLMAILGIGAGVFLAYASAKFAVKEDPRIKLIEAALPGVNCGACGFPGCPAFAKAIASGSAPLDGCLPGKRSGVPEKIKTIVETDPEKLILFFEESGEDAQKALEKLMEASGAKPKPAPAKPTRPTQEEIDAFKAKLKDNNRAMIVYSILPNINCGICGAPGCAAFALKIAAKEDSPDKCIPGKRQNTPQKVEKILALGDSEIEKILAEAAGDVAEIKKRLEVYF